MFAEHSRGTLEPGKLAHLVMIDSGVTHIAPEKIREARVVLTLVGGEIVYERPAASRAKIGAAWRGSRLT